MTAVEWKTKRLWLVRHGATIWNAERRYCGSSDIPLSEEGQQQALWLGQRLRSVSFSTIYYSPTGRARATAEAIASAHREPLHLHVDDRWREIDFGPWEGLTYAEITARDPDYPGFFSVPQRYVPPGAESLEAVVQRVQEGLDALVRADEESCLLVGHGGSLRLLLCLLLDMPLEQQWRFRLDPGSLSAVELFYQAETRPQATLILLNEQQKVENP
uniref:Alpha-ribazole phosphatase n=1 Tax=Thermosporothrix sp. COM3 TaxID=2490863 RepID=A0A455SG16_9CHLR|nr:alpha-ribazole phosphatase [Thermosporothrix sp. COM3]